MRNAKVRIADIVFAASSDGLIDLPSLEDSYRDFICTEAPEVVIRGHCSGDSEIPLRDEDRIFESGIFWDIYKIDGLPAFVLKRSASSSLAYCTAVFSADFRRGDVYYNASDLGEVSADDLLPHPLAFPLFHLLVVSLLAQGYGLLIHACGIDDGGRGLLFPGSSGYGKTTMARLWKDKAVVLNDERIIVRLHDDRLWIYGTPWHGEYNSVSPRGVPLGRVFFLYQTETNSVRRQESSDAATKLLSHCLLPFWDVEGMNFVLDFCTRVVTDVSCYELGFVPDGSIVDFIQGIGE